MILLFLDSIVDDNKFLKFGFGAAGTNVDGHLQVLGVRIDPDEDDTSLAHF